MTPKNTHTSLNKHTPRPQGGTGAYPRGPFYKSPIHTTTSRTYWGCKGYSAVCLFQFLGAGVCLNVHHLCLSKPLICNHHPPCVSTCSIYDIIRVNSGYGGQEECVIVCNYSVCLDGYNNRFCMWCMCTGTHKCPSDLQHHSVCVCVFLCDFGGSNRASSAFCLCFRSYKQLHFLPAPHS